MSINLSLVSNSRGAFTVEVQTQNGTPFRGSSATLERISSATSRCRTVQQVAYNLDGSGSVMRNTNVELINSGQPVCSNTTVNVTFSDPADAARYNGDYNLIIDPSY